MRAPTAQPAQLDRRGLRDLLAPRARRERHLLCLALRAQLARQVLLARLLAYLGPRGRQGPQGRQALILQSPDLRAPQARLDTKELMVALAPPALLVRSARPALQAAQLAPQALLARLGLRVPPQQLLAPQAQLGPLARLPQWQARPAQLAQLD